MSHVLAIARREIQERAFVFVAAFAIAIVPFVVLVVPHGSFSDRKSGVVALGFFLAVAFTWALALILGVTLVGRELSEKRLSFYFTRPISGAAIWFGKLAAAIVLLAGGFAIVHAIPLGIGGTEWQTMSTVSRADAAAIIAGTALLLLLLAHLLSTAIRSRSPILAADFVALLIVGGILATAFLPLVFKLALQTTVLLLEFLGVAIVIAAVGGGAWQLSRGRIDARRSHRELSTFVWAIVGAAAIAILLYSRWVLCAGPRDITRPSAAQRGNMIAMQGPARGYWPEFIVNAANGAYVDASRPAAVSGNAVATVTPAATLANVQRAFGKGGTSFDSTLTVSRLDAKARTVATLPLNGSVKAVGVSGDGSRVAVVADGILTVYDTASRHALASSVLDATRESQLQFVSPWVVRAFLPAEGARQLRVREFDVRARRWSDVAGPLPFQFRIAGSLLMTREGPTATIRDLNNPAAVHTLTIGPDNGVWLMRDGRLAIYHYGKPAFIEIRRNGVQQHLIHFDEGAVGVRVAAEIGRGKLLISTQTRSTNERFDNTTYILDADTGTLSAPIQHASALPTWPSGLGAAEPGETHHAIVHRDTAKMDVVDLQTGAIRPLFE
jgi:ABC-type transport system involved in multi-copper enzyme maturation permease subunit